MSKPKPAPVHYSTEQEPSSSDSSTNFTGSGQVMALFRSQPVFFVWLVFLSLGGTLLALYYANIGYLPDIEWSSSLVYLAAASVIGGGIGLLFALSLFAPGFIWQEFLVFDSDLVDHFCKKAGTPCIWTVARDLGLPFGLVLIASHISLLSLSREPAPGPIGTALLLTALLVLTCLYAWLRIGKFRRVTTGASGSMDRSEDATRDKFRYTFWFALSIFVSQLSMLVFYVLSGKPTGAAFWETTILCITGVLISNHIVAVRCRVKMHQAAAASLVIAFFLLFAADHFSPLSVKIMANFGFGEGHTFNFVLNEEGAQLARELAGANTCTAASPQTVCGVEILSKVGPEYYLRLQDGRTFLLHKTAVSAIIAEKAAAK